MLTVNLSLFVSSLIGGPKGQNIDLSAINIRYVNPRPLWRGACRCEFLADGKEKEGK